MTLRKALIIFVVFLSGLSGFFGYWYYQRNVYSKEVLKLEILAKDKINLAEEIEYIVRYKNNGNIRLEDARLIFEYPKNSLVKEGTTRKEIVLGDIYPGEEKTISLKARLLGREGEVKEAKASLSYRPRNLQARYESVTTHSVIIQSVPLTFDFDIPSRIEPGKEMRFRINYFSNVDYPLSNLGIIVEYPEGFEFLEASPKSLDGKQWDVGLLNKAEGGRIEIVGNVLGQVGQEHHFKAKLGIWQEGEFIVLKEIVRGVKLVVPAIYISQEINGNPKYIASPGDSLHYEIIFRNIGDEALENLFLVSRLDGKAFDFSTIKAPLGDFEPGDNSVIFDWRQVPQLRVLPPQTEGRVEFWIDLKDSWEEDQNPVIRNKIYLSQAREEFITKVNSKLDVSQKAYFEDEVFGNSGPNPPRVGQTTTYTVMWFVKNYYNSLKNVKLKAVLPKNVRLTGKIFPEDQEESLTFDSQSREVIWSAGDLNIGEEKNLSFQISFTPDSSQSGEIAELVGEVQASGEDQWTGQTISSSNEKLESETVK